MNWENSNAILKEKEEEFPDNMVGVVSFIPWSQAVSNMHQQPIPIRTKYITVDFHMRDDLKTEDLEIFASTGGAFEFLKEPAEEKYSPADGTDL
jgi:hypothetical protein